MTGRRPVNGSTTEWCWSRSRSGPPSLGAERTLLMAPNRYVGIEIGGTKLQVVAGDAAGSIRERRRFAVDLSDWRIAHDIEYTFQPGVVLPAGETLYLSPDVVAFRARDTAPTGNEGHFVQGNYRGRLSNRWGLLVLHDADGRMAARKLFFSIGDRLP